MNILPKELQTIRDSYTNTNGEHSKKLGFDECYTAIQQNPGLVGDNSFIEAKRLELLTLIRGVCLGVSWNGMNGWKAIERIEGYFLQYDKDIAAHKGEEPSSDEQKQKS